MSFSWRDLVPDGLEDEVEGLAEALQSVDDELPQVVAGLKSLISIAEKAAPLVSLVNPQAGAIIVAGLTIARKVRDVLDTSEPETPQ